VGGPVLVGGPPPESRLKSGPDANAALNWTCLLANWHVIPFAVFLLLSRSKIDEN